MNAFSHIGNKTESVSHQRLNGSIQSRLKIGQSGGKYEREADRVADAVMRMPAPRAQMQPLEEEQLQMKPELDSPSQMKPEGPQVQRMCPRCRERARQGQPLDCPECEQKLQMSPVIQTKVEGLTHATPQISNQLQTSKGQGARLSSNIQQEMGHKMGADFSGVHVYTDAKSHQLNEQLGAKAFTHGSDIYFNNGEYNPHSKSGKRLLAHELTHVVQQDKSNNYSHSPKTFQASKNSVQRQQSDEKETGPGFVALERITKKLETWRLYNFDVGSSKLKNGHKEGLRSNIMTKIPTDQSTELRIALIGHASRTGDEGDNLTLSKRRAMSVYKWMRTQGVAESVFLGEPVSALGEGSPLERGTPDETEVAEDRAVRIQIWHPEKPQDKCNEVADWQWQALFDHHLDACNAIHFLGKAVFDSICQRVPLGVCSASWTLKDVSEDLKKLYETCCKLPESADQKNTQQEVFECVMKDVQSEIERQLHIPCSKNRIKAEYRKWAEQKAKEANKNLK